MIAKVTWYATYEGLIPEEIQLKFLNTAYSDSSIKLRIDRSLILVVEKEKEVVGYANFSRINENNEAELGAIYIYPKWDLVKGFLKKELRSLRMLKSCMSM